MPLRMVIELWPCVYRGGCKKDGCDVEASVLARYVDEQGRSLRELEFCERHALALGRSFIIRDMR